MDKAQKVISLRKLKAALEQISKAEVLQKPYVSEAQRRWAHTPTGKKALGGRAKVAHWDKASAGRSLPERAGKKTRLMKIDVHLYDSEVDGLHKAEYYKPTGEGEVHPDKGYVSGMFHNQPSWFAAPQVQANHDVHLNDERLVNRFLSNIPSQRHQKALKALINRVKADPYRHAIPTRDPRTDRHSLRARHINSLLFGDKNFTIDTSKPDELNITAKERHGTLTGPTMFRYYIQEVPHASQASMPDEQRGAQGASANVRGLEFNSGRGGNEGSSGNLARSEHPSEDRGSDFEDLEKGANGDWETEGYSIKHIPSSIHYPTNPTSDRFEIKAFDKEGNHAGFATFEHHKNGPFIYPSMITIGPLHRRLGLATAMYNMAEKLSGKALRPEGPDSQTEDAKSLWAQTNRSFGKSEDLAKGKKDVTQMLGTDASKPEHQEYIKWATTKLPNSNWQTWATRNYRSNPGSFTPETKQKIEHFAGSTHIPDIANVRFDKQHDLRTGINMFQQAQDAYNERVKKDANVVVPTSETIKTVHVPNSQAHWYDLGVGSCKNEGQAMGHCGNVPSEFPGDRVLSLRTVHNLGGQVYHEPHLTFINNNGYLGEMKGRGNEKPSEKYHPHIVELLKNPNTKGIIGGGYEPQKNFEFSDLSPAHRQEVLSHNPRLITDADSDSKVNAIKLLNANLPEKFHDLNRKAAFVLMKDPDYHEKLASNSHWDVRSAIAQNPNLDPKLHEKLANDVYRTVRSAIAQNPNLDPKYYVKLANDSHWDVRSAIAQKPNLDPKLYEKLANDENSVVRRSIAQKPNLDSKLHEKLANDEDGTVRQAAIENSNYEALANQNKKSEDHQMLDLRKTSATSQSTSNTLLKSPTEFTNWEAHPDDPTPYKPDPTAAHLKTYAFPNGIKHEIHKSPGIDITHHVLVHPDAGHVATMSVLGTKKPRIIASEVHEDYRGQGLGKQLYIASLLHHGKLHSDEQMTKEADRVWSSLEKVPGIKVERKSKLGTNLDQHFAQTDGRVDLKPLFQAVSKPLHKDEYADIRDLVHYSKRPDLVHVNPEYMGTGAPSSETRWGVPSVKRSYYYTAGSEPESLVTSSSPHKYTAKLHPEHSIYDIYEDPDGLVRASHAEIGRLDPDHFLGKIKAAGHYGYRTTSPNAMNNVIGLFHPHPVSLAKISDDSPQELQSSESQPLLHQPVDHNEFHSAINNVIQQSPRMKENLTVHPMEFYKESKTFLSPDKKSGFAISPSGELTNVFSTEKGRGNHIVSQAIKEGAKHLDAFEGHLTDLYGRHGFKEYHRKPNWTPGGPDVVYMRHANAMAKSEASMMDPDEDEILDFDYVAPEPREDVKTLEDVRAILETERIEHCDIPENEVISSATHRWLE